MLDTDLPPIALSVRQPWAWAIIHAGKDIENRGWQEPYLLKQRGRIAIHSPQMMIQQYYVDAREFMLSIGVECPLPVDLERGGIIGSVEITDVVRESTSPWFSGPCGFVLRDPRPHPIVWVLGRHKFFRWKETKESRARVEPCGWVLKRSAVLRAAMEDRAA